MMDLEALTTPELESLIADAQAVIEQRRLRAKAELRARLATEAEALGFSLEDVLKEFAEAKPLERAVKGTEYRNPDNPDQVWKGEGKKPRWVKEYEAGGGLLSDLAKSATPPEGEGRRKPKLRDRSGIDVWI